MTTINIQTASLNLSNTAPYQVAKGHLGNSGPSFTDMLPPHEESRSSSNNLPGNGSPTQHSAHQNPMEKSAGNFSTMERVQTLKHGPQSPTVPEGEGHIYTEGHTLPLSNTVPFTIFGHKPEQPLSQNVSPTILAHADGKANIMTQGPGHGLGVSEQMAPAGAQRAQATHQLLVDTPNAHQKIGRQPIVSSADEEHPTPLHQAKSSMIDEGQVASHVALANPNNIASYGNGSPVIDKKKQESNNQGALVLASTHYELPHHEVGVPKSVPLPIAASVGVADLTHNEAPNSVTPQATPTPVGQANLGQITQTISSLAPIGGSAKITLHPETLGSLSIHLNVSEHGVANVRIIASTEAGFQAVRDSSSALAQSMTQAGLIAGPIQVTQAPTPVTAGSQGSQAFSSTMGGSSGQGQQQNQPGSSQNLNQPDVASVRDDTVVAYA